MDKEYDDLVQNFFFVFVFGLVQNQHKSSAHEVLIMHIYISLLYRHWFR